MKELTIGEVARRSGIRTSALRYYEDAGVLPPARRRNGRRVYGTEVLRVVDVLKFAQRAGFSLAEIRTLFHGFGAQTPLSDRWEALAHAKLQELDEVIAQAQRMKHALQAGLACGCVRVEDCVVGEAATEIQRDPPPPASTRIRRGRGARSGVSREGL